MPACQDARTAERCRFPEYLISSYREALLLSRGFGFTIPTAWGAAIAVASSVRLAGRAYRLDGAGTDYPSSPLRRYEAPTAMGYP